MVKVCRLAQVGFDGVVEADESCPFQVVVLLPDDFAA
jgi:hypothetical protein